MAENHLHGYPVDSVGGKAIQRGRDAYDNGDSQPPYTWPFLEARGWYDRKAEQGPRHDQP